MTSPHQDPHTDVWDPKMADLLTGPEVAAMFRVDPKTVSRWAGSNKLPSVRTPGGHLRFNATVVRDHLANSVEQPGQVR
jgi:excisionase family DNA binding protein